MNILDPRYLKDPSSFVRDYVRTVPRDGNPGRTLCSYAHAVRKHFGMPGYADRLRAAVGAAGLQVPDESEFDGLGTSEVDESEVEAVEAVPEP